MKDEKEISVELSSIACGGVDVFSMLNYLSKFFRQPYKRLDVKSRLINNPSIAILPLLLLDLISFIYENDELFSDSSINDQLSNLSFWNEIECNDPNITPKEKLKQFRNCFEHANYYATIDKKDYLDVKYHFGNDYINGYITFEDLKNLSVSLCTLYATCNSKGIYFGIVSEYNNRYDGRNKEELLKILDGIIHYNVVPRKAPLSRYEIKMNNSNVTDNTHLYTPAIDINDPEFKADFLSQPRMLELIQDIIKSGNNYITLTGERLSKEEKDFLFKKAQFVTNNFSHPFVLSNYFMTTGGSYELTPLLFEEVSHFIKYVYTTKKKKLSLYDYQNDLIKSGNDRMNKDVIGLAPELYAYIIIALANFYLIYLHETNKKAKSKIEYKNINLDGIKIENNSKEKLVKQVDHLKEAKEELEKLQNELNKFPENYYNLYLKFKLLNDYRNKNPKKEEHKIIQREKMKDLIEKSQKLRIDIKNTEKRIEELKNETPYSDSYNFFRHLRNASAHRPKRTISYDDAFSSNNLDNILVTFTDNDDKGKIEISMTIGRLRKLIEDMAWDAFRKNEEEKNVVIDKTFDEALKVISKETRPF